MTGKPCIVTENHYLGNVSYGFNFRDPTYHYLDTTYFNDDHSVSRVVHHCYPEKGPSIDEICRALELIKED